MFISALIFVLVSPVVACVTPPGVAIPLLIVGTPAIPTVALLIGQARRFSFNRSDAWFLVTLEVPAVIACAVGIWVLVLGFTLWPVLEELETFLVISLVYSYALSLVLGCLVMAFAFHEPKVAPGHGLCPDCQYRIDNIPGPNCPECGQRFAQEPDDWTPKDMFKRDAGPTGGA